MKINQLFPLALSCALVILFSACKKDNTASLNIHVLDPNQNAAANIKFEFLEITDEIFFVKNRLTSSATGDLSLTLTKGKSYFIYLNASENYSDCYMGNSSASLLAIGTFKSLEEINNSPVQKPTPKIGDPKYGDFNHDGAINIDDLVLKVDLKDDAQITVNLIAGRNAFYKN